MKRFALFLLSSLAETATSALIIDDFSSGGITLDTVNGVGSASFIASEFRNPSPDFSNLTRRLEATYSTRLTVEPDTDSFTFQATGSRGNGLSNSAGYFELLWVFDSPVSLLGSGNTTFLIDVLSLDRLSTSIFVAANGVRYRGPNLLRTSAPGPLQFDFSDFPEVDFSAIESIRISTLRQTSGSSLSIGSLTVIPEPSTAGFLGFAVLALLRRRRNWETTTILTRSR